MREGNTRELLRLLQQHAPCSRADLVRLSGLTAPTVSAVIQALGDKGLVRYVGDGKPKNGRPPQLIQFNGDHAFVVGADIGGSTVRLALADLNGKIVARWSSKLGAVRTPEAVTRIVAQGVEALREQAGVAAKKIVELAAGAPGITDVRAGRVVSAPNLTQWHDVPLRAMLRDKTSISTTIENDVNLAAIGEHWCGVAQNVSDFVFLAIGTGVGAGIVIGGHLHRGANWSAGEVGYMHLPGLRSSPLAVDQLGALESATGGQSIERAWKSAANGNGRQAMSATDIFREAARGDRAARGILNETAEHLAVAITNMSLVLDMAMVVIGGGVACEPLLKATEERLAKNEFARPKLVLSSLGPDAQLHGAVRLALLAAEAHGYQKNGKRTGTETFIAQLR